MRGRCVCVQFVRRAQRRDGVRDKTHDFTGYSVLTLLQPFNYHLWLLPSQHFPRLYLLFLATCHCRVSCVDQTEQWEAQKRRRRLGGWDAQPSLDETPAASE